MFICSWNNKQGDLHSLERDESYEKEAWNFRCDFDTDAFTSLLIGSSSWGIMNKIMQKASWPSIEIILIFFGQAAWYHAFPNWHSYKLLLFFQFSTQMAEFFCCKISSDGLTQNYMKCYTCFIDMKYLTFNEFPCLIGKSYLFSTI